MDTYDQLSSVKETYQMLTKKNPNSIVRSTLQIDPPLIKWLKFILVITNSMGCDHQTLNDHKSFNHWNYGDRNCDWTFWLSKLWQPKMWPNNFDCQNYGDWTILVIENITIESIFGH